MSARFTFGTKSSLFNEAARIIKSNLLNEAKSVEQKKKCAARLYDITEEIATADMSDPEKRTYYTILLEAKKLGGNEETQEVYNKLATHFYKKCSAALEGYQPALEGDELSPPASSYKPPAL